MKINENEGLCLASALDLFSLQYQYSSSSTVLKSDSIVACLKGMYENQSNETSVYVVYSLNNNNSIV